MVRPLVKQTIARDQTEVASKLDDLLNQNAIDRDTIIDVEVERFGANQFLILAVYYGSYILWALDGLASTVVRKLGIGRGFSATGGLTSVVARLFGALRGLSASLGLSSAAIARTCTFERTLSVAFGLVSKAISSRKLESEFVAAGLITSLGREVGWLSPSQSTKLGLTCDVSYTYYKP